MHWQELYAHLSLLVEGYDFSIPELPGLDFSRIDLDWQRLRGSIPEIWKFTNDGREFQVGEQMKARGLTAEYPVILIPGVISTVVAFICSVHHCLI
jgi:phospholipid:diacylglycerol acyltransferase